MLPMALTKLYIEKMRGAFRFSCGVCNEPFLARGRNRRYCSRDCGREGRLRHQRAWARQDYVRHEMDPGRIVELLELVSRMPAFGGVPAVNRLMHARRMMAYA